MQEFSLIERYFHHWPVGRHAPHLGIGDDAALVTLPPGYELAVSVDSLVAGVHFPLDCAPEDIGFKALAVNVSDLAAMGAEPAWFTLSLTCPQAQPSWLEAFSAGLREAAALSKITLIGGDTTQGPLTISIQVLGLVPQGQAIRRSGARPGDELWVTGTLGDAALGLLHWGEEHPCIARLTRPVPRTACGIKLRGLAHAMIDISDGLASDVAHLAAASGVGIRISVADLPLSPALGRLPAEQAWRLALTGGDDYELCFTTAPNSQQVVHQVCHPIPVTRIGVCEATGGCSFYLPNGQAWLPGRGWEHFADKSPYEKAETNAPPI